MPERDKELDEVLAGIRRKRDEDIAALQSECERLIEIAEQRIREAIRFHGKKPCPKCKCKGVIQRLDSGHMWRFGLHEWIGCENCGGDEGETRGCGYVDA